MPSDQEFENELKRCFLEEAQNLLDEVERHLLDAEASPAPALKALSRILHNLKGGSQSVGLKPFGQVVHRWETLVQTIQKQGGGFSRPQLEASFQWRDGLKRLLEIYLADPSAEPDISNLMKLEPSHSPVAGETLRIPKARIDLLVDNLGEMGVLQTSLKEMLADFSMPASGRRVFEQWDKLLRDTQAVAFGLSMVPIRPLFQRMRRVVKDLSAQLGKQVELELCGEETEIETGILESLGDPLMHLIRNAIDHGIEGAPERARLGKPVTGRLTLSAYHRGDRVGIECRDDGGGMDPAILVRRAREKKLITDDSTLSATEALELIFLPGFSTAETITDVSGRGVGMDIVKANLSALGGRIEIDSAPGKGTCFRLLLPFHLALLDALQVRVAGQTYAIPLASLEEVVEYDPGNAREEGPDTFVSYRGESLPLFDLGILLQETPTPASTLLILRDHDGARYGMKVAEVLAKKEVLMKRPGADLQKPWISGYTILADGKVSLVLDVRGLMA